MGTSISGQWYSDSFPVFTASSPSLQMKMRNSMQPYCHVRRVVHVEVADEDEAGYPR